MVELSLRNRHPRRRVNSALLRRIALAALAESPFSAHGSVSQPRELSVLLVDGKTITWLNWRWLARQGPTDVIAFDHSEWLGARNSRPLTCGDVVISLDDARHQARRFHTSWQAELVRCMVHGFLHLSGYDDQTPASQRRMKKAEDRAMRRLSRRFFLSGLGSRTGVLQFLK